MKRRLIQFGMMLLMITGMNTLVAQKQVSVRVMNQYEATADVFTLDGVEYKTAKDGSVTLTISAADSVTFGGVVYDAKTIAVADLAEGTTVELKKHFTWKDILNPMFYIKYGGLWLLLFIIFAETGLTASAGVAPNKFLAKIASDENKPDGLFVLPPEKVSDFVKFLPLQKIPGVGKKTAERLATLGFYKCVDIQNASLHTLVKHFGSFADTLIERSFGRDSRDVQNDYPRKSVAVEHTYTEDLPDLNAGQQSLSELLPKLRRRIERCEASAHIQKIGIKLKFADFQQTTVEKQQPELDMASLKQLLEQAWHRGQGKHARKNG